ncbi:endonuclease III domain-containing protein [Virgibacillus sp. NKC19-16]|uniref:endonuclease III domain-containing protein n=1 Tax=Virgibacillus salidurans TaxID=2831673 RepID=UPI001F4415CA|nr:endonuclease III domain-containing protein [Virgibacillus sp. NKC19-16]UJL46289.1 endonuclease III domain-containing protein [Virgibacillus sp. NKC19-16]
MEGGYQLIYQKLYDYYGPQNWWPAETIPEMMIGSILVQNTNWRNANKALHNLRTLLDPAVIDRMSVEELAQLIRSSGFFNIKAKRIKAFLEWFKGYDFDIDKFKDVDKLELRRELLTINGIGRETADVMLLYAFDKPIFVVDAYARRIFYRLGLDMPKSYDGFRKEIEEATPGDLQLYNEFHALIVEHAKVHCKQAPICEGCPLFAICDRRLE